MNFLFSRLSNLIWYFCWFCRLLYYVPHITWCGERMVKRYFKKSFYDDDSKRENIKAIGHMIYRLVRRIYAVTTQQYRNYGENHNTTQYLFPP